MGFTVFHSFQIEEDPFNPDYVEVDRVLEVSYCEDKDTGQVTYISLLLVIEFQQKMSLVSFAPRRGFLTPSY